MSLFGMMRTGVSGMQGQSNLLATVADNIQNAGTTGYKKVGVEFSSLLVGGSQSGHSPGGLVSNIRQSISEQGILQPTGNPFDMAIEGSGFFVVQDSEGNSFLTRAGSFVPDDEGRLVNAAGYYLAGSSYANGDPVTVANGLQGLDPVRVSLEGLIAEPSTEARLAGNLPADAEVVTGSLPSDNNGNAEYTEKKSLIVYDNLGREVLLDIYMTRIADTTPDGEPQWEVTIFNQDKAASGTSFPYDGGPLSVQNLTYDPDTGMLTGGGAITVQVPGGQPLTLDLSGMTQLGPDFKIDDVDVNGISPEGVAAVSIGSDGIVSAIFSSGTVRPLFRVPLATVPSPDLLTMLSGNLFAANPQSGGVQVNFPGEGQGGVIRSNNLETSTVDIADELTDMIEAQKNYTANSKVFQAGSELIDVLLTLKR